MDGWWCVMRVWFWSRRGELELFLDRTARDGGREVMAVRAVVIVHEGIV